jgi:hypothetical protein
MDAPTPEDPKKWDKIEIIMTVLLVPYAFVAFVFIGSLLGLDDLIFYGIDWMLQVAR